MRLPEWRTVRAIVSAFGAVVAAAATAFLALVNAKVWMGSDREKFWAVATVAAVAIGSSVARPVRIVVLGKQVKQRLQIGAALRSLPWSINQQTDGAVPVPPLGASAWLVKGYGKRQALKRIGRERVQDTPGPSNVKWIKGKGALGRCWELERAQVIDTGKIDARWGKCSQDDWEQKCRPDTRMGLTYEEFRKVTGKYGTVIAVPMFDARNDKVIGCVSLDAPAGLHLQLVNADAEAAVASAAVVIAALLG